MIFNYFPIPWRGRKISWVTLVRLRSRFSRSGGAKLAYCLTPMSVTAVFSKTRVTRLGIADKNITQTPESPDWVLLTRTHHKHQRHEAGYCWQEHHTNTRVTGLGTADKNTTQTPELPGWVLLTRTPHKHQSHQAGYCWQEHHTNTRVTRLGTADKNTTQTPESPGWVLLTRTADKHQSHRAGYCWQHHTNTWQHSVHCYHHLNTTFSSTSSSIFNLLLRLMLIIIIIIIIVITASVQTCQHWEAVVFHLLTAAKIQLPQHLQC